MSTRNWKPVALKAIGILAVIAFLYIALIPLSGEFERAGAFLTRNGGLAGVFAYVFIVDTFIVPATLDIIFPLVITWAAVPVLAVMGTASVMGGICGYLIGRFLNHFAFVRRHTERYRSRGEYLIKRYGIWAVIVAALLPLPFSTISWIAGALQMNVAHFVIGALFRVPRIIATYALLRAGVSFFS
ncbi:MAG: YqaA family protein [Spirochaetales bacterium]